MNVDLIKQYVSPQKVLDIGANVGDFYRTITALFPDCICLLIEGNPDCEVYLKQLGVSYHICLLGNLNRDVTFYKNKKNPICTGSSMFRELSEHYDDSNVEAVTLQCHRLDDLNKNNVIFDLVKMDTQGSEMDIFLGGVKTLIKSKAIIMETSLIQYNSGSPLQKEVIEFMARYGFNNVGIVSEGRADGGRGEIIQQDILFLNKNA
jgi:FkbM family methyltransferase